MQQDDIILDTIATKQSRFLTKLGQEHTRINAITVKTSWFASLRTLFSVILSLIIFVAMLLVIHFFPSTSYISLNKS